MNTALRRTDAARRRAPACPSGVWAVWAVATAALAGCGNIQVRPLATGDVERPAFALSGPSMDSLRDEARRLCPSGADVLRAAQRFDGRHAIQQPQAESWYGRWWEKTQAGMTHLAPATGESQLVVLCQPLPGIASLAAAPAAHASPGKHATPPASGSAADAPKPRPGLSGHEQLAPIGEGDARLMTPAVRAARNDTPSATAAPSSGRGADLRSGMTAAMPSNAVVSGRPGAAPAVPGFGTAGRDSAAATAGAGGTHPGAVDDAAGKARQASRPARGASAPILSY